MLGGIRLSTLRGLAYWLGAVLPGVPRPLLAVASVLAGGIIARLLGERAPLWCRLAVVVAGALFACLILVPMVVT